MQKIQALIFDMDGVIVDSELHWKSLEGFFLQSLIPGWTAVDQGRIIGRDTGTAQHVDREAGAVAVAGGGSLFVIVGTFPVAEA